MGGIGSGDWCRWDSKATIEDGLKIDIFYLRKQGVLKHSGATGNLSWSRDGKEQGVISFGVGTDRLVLMYSHSKYGGERQEVKETIMFDRTSCNYGGERVWFLCPECEKRVAVLYCASGRFLCRHCNNLPYTSQNETHMDRMRRKAGKIRHNLGASQDLTVPVWEKPKGMHWKTFNRLLREEKKANEASVFAMAKKLRMFERLGWL